jgi:hypothetical protein
MRNGLVWNRCCPTRSRVVVGGGPITARCSTGCSGGPVVVSRGGMCRLRSEAGRPSRTGIAAGQVTAPWLGSWTPCAAAPTWPKARTGRSGWTARWSAPISTPPVPATPRPPTLPRRHQVDGGLLGVVGQEDERGVAVAEAVDELLGPGDRLPAAVDDPVHVRDDAEAGHAPSRALRGARHGTPPRATITWTSRILTIVSTA